MDEEVLVSPQLSSARRLIMMWRKAVPLLFKLDRVLCIYS